MALASISALNGMEHAGSSLTVPGSTDNWRTGWSIKPTQA